jgi:acyl dehydratase
MRSKCLEEFEIGQFDESRALTITETDVVTFSWVSGGVNTMHTDAVHNAKSPIGQRIAHGALSLSIATGLKAGLGCLKRTAIAALGIGQWRFLKPILFNDIIRLNGYRCFCTVQFQV